MANRIYADAFIKEMQSEYNATKRCLERISAELYEFKPHPRSMNLGYLTLLVAEIPLWINMIVEKGVVDFATYKQFELSTSEKMQEHYEDSFSKAVEALKKITDEDLEQSFVLKNGDTELMKQTRNEAVSSSINHWIHHRGQLTVYMRLNEIAVPSIYGPSADEKGF